MMPREWLMQAADRIAPYIHHTPVTYDPQSEVYFKWENRQVTGSFKARGALNKILSLQAWECERGLVAASAGNHGQGVAFAGQLVSAPVVIFCSNQAVLAKVQAMQTLGAEVRLVPGGYGEAEQAGREYADINGATWISPYNDGQVIAGQGTLGLELLQDLPDLASAVWIVPTGGGGLVSGIGIALDQQPTATRIVAVQPKASPFFHALFYDRPQQGVVDLPTLADGLAGPVEQNSLTIPLVRRFVNEFVLVDEIEIVQAIAYAWHKYGEVIEGSAAAGLAAILSGKISTRPAVAIITGGNIQPEVHTRITAW
jgi:threonine dehydratase